MLDITYGAASDANADELLDFYHRLRHDIAAKPTELKRMLECSQACVTARVGGKLVGIARGLCDGLRGYLAECKLDPEFQGPAAVTRTDGRIEHDQYGIGAEMAHRVIETLVAQGVRRIDALAWGTEVDFCEELGFRRSGGLVGLTMDAAEAGARERAMAAAAE